MTINFVDASEGVIETYGWDFGDGSISFAENPSHTYADPLAASYDVLHYVAGDKGMDSITKTITVPTFTVVVGLMVDMDANPAANVVAAADFINDPGDCENFSIGRAADGPFASTLTFDCDDRPTLGLFVRGTQLVTGLARVQTAVLTITDSGGVCP